MSCVFQCRPMLVFLLFYGFLFVGESPYSVLLCMPDKVCELVSLTHQRGDTLVSDNVSW